MKESGTNGRKPDGKKSNGKKELKWTVMVYMAADTGDRFYHHAINDLTEMTRAKFGDRVKVLVHAEAPFPWDSQFYETWEVKPGAMLPLDWQVRSLAQFVQRCGSAPELMAENYLLVLWGHGEGIDWVEEVLADQGPPIARVGKRFGRGSEGHLEIGELGKALAQLDWGNIKKEQLIVGFDACLMGMVEVFYEVKENVRWVVAANDEIPDTGWPYENVFNALDEDPESGEVEIRRISRAIVRKCAEYYSNKESKAAVSFSACDLSKFENGSGGLFKAMGELKKQLTKGLGTDWILEAITTARDDAEDLNEHAYVDLNYFCVTLASIIAKSAGADPEKEAEATALKSAAKQVVAVLNGENSFVFSHKYSDSYPQKYVNDARAVSICFPETAALAGSMPGQRIDWGSYEELHFTAGIGWHEFLQRYWDTLANQTA